MLHFFPFIDALEETLARWRKPLTQALLASECKIVRLTKGVVDGTGS